MTVLLSELSNSELARKLGMTASAASYLRNGHRLPGPQTQRVLVQEFGATYNEINEAMIEAQRGNRERWVEMISQLESKPPVTRLSEVRRRYSVPAHRGAPVIFHGREATIVGVKDGQLVIKTGDGFRFEVHPTWGLEYVS